MERGKGRTGSEGQSAGLRRTGTAGRAEESARREVAVPGQDRRSGLVAAGSRRGGGDRRSGSRRHRTEFRRSEEIHKGRGGRRKGERRKRGRKSNGVGDGTRVGYKGDGDKNGGFKVRYRAEVRERR
ncbi:hypothetical protein Tco_1089434 [Tanacetum coccineum]